MRTAFLASFVWSCHEQLNFQRIDLPSEYMTSRPLREWAWQEELGSVYFDYTVLLFGILSRFGNSLYSAMLFFFWLILCNLGSLRDVCDYCSLHNSHNCHIKMMKKREWPVRHHDTIISKKKIFWPPLDFSQGRERYHTGGPYDAWRHPSPVRHYKWNSVPWFKSRFEDALS